MNDGNKDPTTPYDCCDHEPTCGNDDSTMMCDCGDDQAKLTGPECRGPSRQSYAKTLLFMAIMVAAVVVGVVSLLAARTSKAGVPEQPAHAGSAATPAETEGHDTDYGTCEQTAESEPTGSCCSNPSPCCGH